MALVHKLHKDGTLKVPRPLLKEAGLRPGLGVTMYVLNKSLIIEQELGPRSPIKLKALKRLRGCLKHIDWDAAHLDVRERWSAWRNRLSA